MQFKPLCAETIPLYGRHLIEASAGTGKTYNITRIYLRLLLERQIPIEQILVMTFTKDATEELRGRIDALLRDTLTHWSELTQQQPFFQQLATQLTETQAKQLLHRALLFLDEAAIFTIHGFCQRMLKQQAFATGLTFNAQLESHSHDLMAECCQDWYRQLMLAQDSQPFTLVAEFWPTPDTFLAQFGRLLSHNTEPSVVSAQQIQVEFQQLTQTALAALIQHQAQLFNWLVEGKKDAPQRAEQFEQLCAWLADVVSDINALQQAMPSKFISGQRYAKAIFKAELLAILAPVLSIKAKAGTILDAIRKADALTLVKQGIMQIRSKLIEKKQNLNLLNFDDLISVLAHSLAQQAAQQQTGLRDHLFAQYPVALIDEFQDTDVQQFEILTAIYAQQQTAALYLIGDPKQAIYGFRGGDVFAYLAARHFCQQHWIMATNWRSTSALIQGYNRLFYGNDLQHSERDVFHYHIHYFPVNASGQIAEHRQLANDPYQALQFIHFAPEQQQYQSRGNVVAQSFRRQMANWCAGEVQRLLTGYINANGDLAEDARLIRPSDIAILVRDGTEANEIKQALTAANLACVYLSNRANLFHSAQCQSLLQVLKGILLVEDDRLFNAALASPLLNYQASALYQLQHQPLAYQTLRYAFVALRAKWQQQSFISMALTLMHEHFQLPIADKDRALTNLIHLFELLQTASQRHHQPQALLYWFEQQCQADDPQLEAELRLESEADLIKIVTQHGSKGLEYQVVFVPFAGRHKHPLKVGNQYKTVLSYHDEQGVAQLSLDGSKQAKQAMCDEQYAEDVRLLYVAITRAKQRCYLLSCPFDQVHLSPLGHTLGLSEPQALYSNLQQLAAQNADTIGVELVSQVIAPEPNKSKRLSQTQAVRVATFTGQIERDWWLSSFSALTRTTRFSGVSAPDRDMTGVAVQDRLPVETMATDYLARFELAKGANTGNLLHEVLEHADFTKPDWPTLLKRPLQHFGALKPNISEQQLGLWLQQILASRLTDGGRLADLAWHKTLREVEFYFPMAVRKSQQLVHLLTTHRQQLRQRLEDNGESHAKQTAMPVQLPSYRKLLGMMHGFIDLVFEYEGKYYLADYKSSHLGDNFTAYQPTQLLAHIEQNHYDLQYLIYALALHRYLASRLDNYQIEQHFGGVYYLYLRGMSPEPCHDQAGIYFQSIDAKCLSQLDALFAGAVDE